MAYYHRGGRFKRNFNDGPRGRGRGGPPGGSRPSTYYQDIQDDGNTFLVQRPHQYQGPAPQLEVPQVLGSYSIDDERNFGHDHSNLHFLDQKYIPKDGTTMKVHMDLNKGYEEAIRYSGSGHDTFHNLLKWILSNQDKLTSDSSHYKLDVTFVGARRIFTRIMRTPYNTKEKWSLYAKVFKGTIYLMSKAKTETVWVNASTSQEKVEVWGHKFEQYMTGGDTDTGVCANEEFRCVLKGKMEEFTVLYAPEVDCADPEHYDEDFTDLSAFVMVKCCKELQDPFKIKCYKRFKLNQWWTENKLSGIPRIVVGYRNDDGIVHTLEAHRTDDLPEVAQGEWEPNVCLNFTIKFLRYLKKTVEADPAALHLFERESCSNITYSKVADPVEVNILPSWYTEELFSSEDAQDDE